jgi:hypothetical protein
MHASRTTPIEPGNRIQLPEDWVKALGRRGFVTLDKSDNGIIRPSPRYTWDDIFATTLSVHSVKPDTVLEVPDLTGDDLLF